MDLPVRTLYVHGCGSSREEVPDVQAAKPEAGSWKESGMSKWNLGEETKRSFDHRSRESMMEEIMALRWLRTTTGIELLDAAQVLERRAAYLRVLAEGLDRSAKEWAKA